jgi:aspartyl/asparaginyl beta-hydroxylase (cupin superfamily)
MQAQGEIAAEAALDRILGRDPRNVAALIAKGDLKARAGDAPAATSFYQTAISIAERLEPVPPELFPALRRADAYLSESEARYGQYLETYLSQHGLPPERRDARFREALDILVGRRAVYPQQPTVFYFPGLPQRQYFEPGQFAWAAQVEAAAGAIREELGAVLADRSSFKPFHEMRHDRAPSDAHGLMNNPDWSAYYLHSAAGPHRVDMARCPRTMAALRDVPLVDISGTSPSIFFSLLKPGARIAAHHGIMNTRMVCHLGLVVPDNCGLRVGNEARAWEEGKLLIFDDSIEHEAWNNSERERIVLIFEVWRPELTKDDREAIRAVFAAAHSFGR